MEKKTVLIVTEKPSIWKRVNRFIKAHTNWYDIYEVAHDYFGFVSDVRELTLPFYKHEDAWYLYGKPSCFTPLTLPDLEIPTDSYLWCSKQDADSVVACEFRKGVFQLSDIDEIMFIGGRPDYDDKSCYADDLLSARKYLEIVGLENFDICDCMLVPDFTDEELERSFSHPESFSAAYEKLCRYLTDNGFPFTPTFGNDFQRVLLLSNMSLTKFCNYFKVKRRTAENWKYGVAPCSACTLELMEYKLLHEGII